MRWWPSLPVLLGGLAALAACAPPPARLPVGTPAGGPQHITYYQAAQVRYAERTLGYHVVEPIATVRLTTGLGLTLVAVTELSGRRAIHYVFGDTRKDWVLIMETPDGVTSYQYDPKGRAVFFEARGRGLSVSTNLPKRTLDRIVHGLGGPAKPPPETPSA